MRKAHAAGHAGFSLIETMTVVAIGATLTAMALPGLSAQADRRAAGELGAQLAADLRDARQRAIADGHSIIVCARQFGATPACSDAAEDWTNGWLVLRTAVPTRSPTADQGEILVDRQFAPSSGVGALRLDAPGGLEFVGSGSVRRLDATVGAARWRITHATTVAGWVCLTPAGRASTAEPRGC